MHLAMFGAASALVAVLAYSYLQPKYPADKVTDYAIRFGGPVAVGAVVGVVLHMI